MVGQEILLSVPGVAVVPRGHAALMIGGHETVKLVAVRQDFAGEFSGRALLIFPETKSLDLVRAITGGELPLEDVVALEHEALAETGNIILNNCLATMANALQRTLQVSLPDLFRGDGTELFEVAAATDDVVLMLYVPLPSITAISPATSPCSWICRHCVGCKACSTTWLRA